jgi:hypothetical protein
MYGAARGGDEVEAVTKPNVARLRRARGAVERQAVETAGVRRRS